MELSQAIDPGRYYHCMACQGIVWGNMLIGPQPACPCCGHRKGFAIIGKGEPGKVARTIIHGDPDA